MHGGWVFVGLPVVSTMTCVGSVTTLSTNRLPVYFGVDAPKMLH